MAKAIRVHGYGGPEVLRYEDVTVGDPGPGEVRIRQRAVGVNYIDVYHRTGLYPQPAMPFVPGSEGAGEVVAVGEGVTEFKPGDRVAYAMGLGAYAEERLIAAKSLVKLPDGDLGRDRGRHDAEGHDGRLSPAPHLPCPGRRHDPVPCRRGRRRPDRLPVGEASRRDGDRHRGLARTRRGSPARTAATTSSCTGRRIFRPGSSRSRAARAARWSTTASARRPSPPPSTA